MHFDRLRLNGFKSFVDPTDLVIRDGLTGVVGPNGCGKSNLLEALRWVMGENRPTAMRGGGMEDVIFAGTSSRTARAHAEVSLTIDNSQRLAPAGMNDSDQLEIIRRITRDAGSAYRINGRDVRARDVQMLFADASTGAHSPALVRQGQIAELINAKPKARRRILEEAAGISGLYQRRHEAGLKLNAAEQNLTRVDDTLDQLARQAASLARQARTARRYREIGQELRRAERQALWSRWAEAEAQRKTAAAALHDATAAATRAEAAARRAATERSQAEAAMPPFREEEQIAAAILSRATVGREALDNAAKESRKTIENLSARLAQLDKDITREAALNRDAADMVARLQDEGAALEKAHAGHDENLAVAKAAEAEAAETLHQAEAALAELQDEAARLSAQAQSAERLVADLRRMRERATAAGAEAEAGASLAASQAQEARAALAAAEADQAAAEAAIRIAEDQLTRAEAARHTAEATESAARATRAEAEGVAGALVAECDALARLVARNAGHDGQLLDQITVSLGYEAAFGAAFGDDLNLPALGAADQDQPGWQDLPPGPAPLSLPADAQPLAPEVTAPALLSRRLAQIGIVPDRAAGAALQQKLRPGQRLVSKSGDFWRWDGLTIPAGEGTSQAALHLQQVNRLKQLRAEAEAASARANTAIAAHEAAETALRGAAEAETTARQTRREAEQHLSRLSRTLSQAETALATAEAKTARIRAELARHREDENDAANRLALAEKALADLPDRAATTTAVDQARTGVEAARIATLSRRAALDEIGREGTARIRRIQQITQELSGWETRLDQADSRAKELAARHEASTSELAEAEARPAGIAAELARLTEAEAEAETRLAAARAAVEAAETRARDTALAEREAERMASTAREARAAAEARAEAATTAETEAGQHIADEAGTSPDRLRAELGDDDPPPLAMLEADIMRLRSARDALGAVNLRADEDQQALEEERATLDRERSDLAEAIGKLRGGIANLNREGRERLLAAFETVNSNFATLFSHLFGGGEARLIMVESDDPLDAGLEILCQPPGKRLAALSLLSGGEQTLTALALIFAVFLANPAPICVLDEVDAPLDDANVTRFCDMLDQMTARTQTRFLVITHHSVTMARMDRLFGVTMVEQGVSQLVSVNLKAAESLVA